MEACGQAETVESFCGFDGFYGPATDPSVQNTFVNKKQFVERGAALDIVRREGAYVRGSAKMPLRRKRLAAAY